jgi:hypothetical protein
MASRWVDRPQMLKCGVAQFGALMKCVICFTIQWYRVLSYPTSYWMWSIRKAGRGRVSAPP